MRYAKYFEIKQFIKWNAEEIVNWVNDLYKKIGFNFVAYTYDFMGFKLKLSQNKFVTEREYLIWDNAAKELFITDNIDEYSLVNDYGIDDTSIMNHLLED